MSRHTTGRRRRPRNSIHRRFCTCAPQRFPRHRLHTGGVGRAGADRAASAEAPALAADPAGLAEYAKRPHVTKAEAGERLPYVASENESATSLGADRARAEQAWAESCPTGDAKKLGGLLERHEVLGEAAATKRVGLLRRGSPPGSVGRPVLAGQQAVPDHPLKGKNDRLCEPGRAAQPPSLATRPDGVTTDHYASSPDSEGAPFAWRN